MVVAGHIWPGGGKMRINSTAGILNPGVHQNYQGAGYNAGFLSPVAVILKWDG
jgi:hypothetical protein